MLRLVMATAVIVVAAVATNALGSAASDEQQRGSTLTVVLKNRDYSVVDLPPAGPSQGDLRVGNAQLFDRREIRRVGTFHLVCTLTDLAGGANGRVELTQCQYTFRLPGGDIAAQGLTRRASLGAPAAADIQAITGGTGDYRAARGEASLLPPRGDERRIVLHLRS